MSNDVPGPRREEALYTLCLLAAFADGGGSDRERAELKRIGDTLLPDDFHPVEIYQQVLLRRTSAAAVAAELDSPEWRNLAYEMAVKVCEADGVTSTAERAFLDDLAGHLGIAPAAAHELVDQGDLFAAAPVTPADPSLLPALPSGPPVVDSRRDEVDGLVMKYAILNGALELLPETMATLAIIPLQMKLVNAVGNLHGIELDRRQLVEFLGAAGIGATSQVVEGFARKMVGGLAGTLSRQLLGKTIGSLAKGGANQLTSSAFSFGSTWAIGQLAHLYYANGRSWSGIDAKASLAKLNEDAQKLYQQVLPQIKQQAGSLDLQKVMGMARSGAAG